MHRIELNEKALITKIPAIIDKKTVIIAAGQGEHQIIKWRNLRKTSFSFPPTTR